MAKDQVKKDINLEMMEQDPNNNNNGDNNNNNSYTLDANKVQSHLYLASDELILKSINKPQQNGIVARKLEKDIYLPNVKVSDIIGK